MQTLGDNKDIDDPLQPFVRAFPSEFVDGGGRRIWELRKRGLHIGDKQSLSLECAIEDGKQDAYFACKCNCNLPIGRYVVHH